MKPVPDNPIPEASNAFPAGGGETGGLIRALDWSRTSIGATENWSPALRTTVSLMLANRFPLLLWWGPDYISLYNDAYRPVLGAKHPRSMGQAARECWSEIWDVLKPLIDSPFNGGPATWMDDLQLEINRHGFLEETHFTVAYSPVPDDTAPGGVGGVLATVHEITEKIVGERRIAALRDLGARTGEGRTAEEACRIAADALAGHDKDVPFALVYLLDGSGTLAQLACVAGIEPGAPAAPDRIDLRAQDEGQWTWPIADVHRSEAMVTVEDVAGRFGTVPAGPWSDPPHAAVIVPIKSNVVHQLAGFLIAGASPRLRLDEQYRGFFDLVASQIATAIATARAYEEERRRAEALAEIDRAKTLFFSNVSHEFRTPLTLMLGPLEDVLADSRLADGDRDRLDVAHRNSLRLLKLVNSLLDFSRIEAGRAQASYQPTDLAAFTADLASNFRSACERAGLGLVVDCPPLPQPVHVDRDMWEKIVLNLLSNAFKFTFDGEIAAELREGPDGAELTVRDTGVGIPADELPRLFERFHRIDGQKSRTHEGTGIGLALVQELVKLHGGTIRADSAPEKGSVFTVTIPFGTAHLPSGGIGVARTLASTSVRAEAYVQEALSWVPGGAPSSEAPQDIDAADTVPPLRAGARILLADDNADMRAYVSRLLADHCVVETVGDGQAALEVIRERRPDLVLADVMMPCLDGFGLLRTIRGDPSLRELPVIMLSARAGEESRMEGLRAGADGYLVKPFSRRGLIALVDANLKLSGARRHDREKLAGRRRILEKVATDAPLSETLDELMLFIEAQEPGMRCGILLVTEDGARFNRGSGPSLPEEYHSALDGAPITPPYVGSCAEAVHQCCAILVPDIASEARYSEAWRTQMLSSGVRAVRSTAVLGSRGRVLGSVAMYFDQPRDPNPADPELVDMATQLAAIAIERDHANRALVQSERRLAAELAAAQRLQSISAELVHEQDVQVLYERIVDAAAAIMRADCASMQRLQSGRDANGELHLLATHGFTPEARKFWEWVRADSASTCGMALRTRRRTIVTDIERCDFMAGTGTRAAYLDGGILAAQSTPLISRSGHLLGMISTHWRTPHEPTENDLRLFDVLARQAADLIERKQSEDALQRRADQLRLLLDELNHRVKNTLATVQSIAAQTLRNAESTTDARHALESRLLTLARAHDVLTREHWEGANLSDLVTDAVFPYSGDGQASRFDVDGANLRLLPKAVLALSMALQELATNAVKYGALSNGTGRVRIRWGFAPGAPERFQFTWAESGGPRVRKPSQRGFGSRLIERGLAQDLGGTVQLRFASEGLICAIEAPIGEIRAGGRPL